MPTTNPFSKQPGTSETSPSPKKKAEAVKAPASPAGNASGASSQKEASAPQTSAASASNSPASGAAKPPESVVNKHRTFYTFGQGHEHTIAGEKFNKDTVAVISGFSSIQARRLMFTIFGSKWCMEYPEEYWSEEEQLPYFPEGYVEVPAEAIKEALASGVLDD